MFANLKVRVKIYLTVAFMLVAMIAIAIVGLTTASTLNTSNDMLYVRELKGAMHMKNVDIALMNLAFSVREAMLNQSNDFSSIRKHYENSKAGMQSEIDAAEKTFHSPEAVELFRTIHKALPTFFELNDKFFSMAVDKKPLQEIKDAMKGIAAVDAELLGAFRRLVAIKEASGLASMDDTTSLYNRAFWIIIGVLSLALVVGGVLGGMASGAIATPLIEIARKTDLVANGDLSQTYTLTQRDELGLLSDALEKMVHNLRSRISEAEQKSQEAQTQSSKAAQAMQEAERSRDQAEEGQKAILKAAEQIEVVVGRLGSATDELSAQVEQASRSAETQRGKVFNSTSAMTEMNASAMEVAGSATSLSVDTDAAKTKASNGLEVMRKTVQTIHLLQSKTTELKQEMTELGKQTDAIGSIMVVISDIADQTNLLALNAAIEAARAGEAGRGFAVVADEVRKLAEKTMTATKEVGDAIRGIQSNTQRSIASVEQTTTFLGETTELANKSGEALGEIVTGMNGTADQIRGIAAAAGQQSAASDDITRNLSEISQIADENAKAMHDSASAVDELAAQTRELVKLVASLRR